MNALDVNGRPIVLPRSPHGATAAATRGLMLEAWTSPNIMTGHYAGEMADMWAWHAGLAFRAAELVYDAEQRAAAAERRLVKERDAWRTLAVTDADTSEALSTIRQARYVLDAMGIDWVTGELLW